MRIQANRWVASVFVLAASAILSQPARGRADDPVPDSRRPILAAVETTRQRGIPTILIVASRRVPASVEFANAFVESPWARRQRGLAQVLPLVLEDDPQLVASLNVGHFPTAIAYFPGSRGLSRYDTAQECASADSLGSWLDRLVGSPAPAAASGSDPAVDRTAFHGDSYASSQGYASSQTYTPPQPPPAPPAPPQTFAPQPYGTGAPATIGYAPQTATTASVVQMPGQSFVIQPQAPQIFMAPTPAPVVYVPQGTAAPAGMAMAPAGMAMAPAGVAMAPAGNLFLPSGGAGLASVGAAVPAAAPVAIAAQPVPAATGFAMAAQPAGVGVGVAAVTNQQLNLPTQSARTRVRVRGPGPVASAAARFGERLTQFGRTRIETVQETTLAAPIAQAASPGMTTISTSSAVPIAQPQSTIAVPASVPAPPPTVEVPVQRPTPQGYAPHGHDHH